MTSTPHLHALAAPAPRAAYSPEFRAAAVARVDSGEPVAAVARALGVARNTLKTWVRNAEDAPPVSGEGSGIVEAAESGSRRAVLVAIRSELAARIADGVANRDLPAHARLLDEVVREIEMIDQAEQDRADEEAAGIVEDEPLNPEEDL